MSVGWLGTAVAAALGAPAVAIAAWALAEVFVRRRRMALPAIVLLLVFVGAVFFFASAVLWPVGESAGFAIAGLVTAAAAALHWLRFKVPITVAAGAAALVAAGVAAVLAAVPDAQSWLMPLLFAAGVVAFAWALRWDASDAKRETRRSDVAFWLHLLAAPLLVHPVFTAVGMFSGSVGTAQTLAVVALYGVIAVVSLAIDRRALMVSALGYVLYAFSALLQQAGVVSLGFALTALVIGSALLVLSAFWHASRALVVGRLPAALRVRLAAV